MWSAKGGVGLSVSAAAVALLLAERHGSSLLVDLAGDQPALLGLAEPSGPGLGDWLASDADTSDSISRLTLDTPSGLGVLPAGEAGSVDPRRAQLFVELLGRLEVPVVIDCGVRSAGEESVLVDLLCAAGSSVLVSSSCYLALRRAVRLRNSQLSSPGNPSADSHGFGAHGGLVVVSEPGRALDAADVAAVTQIQLCARVERDPAIARCVDAGQFLTRPPRALLKNLEVFA